MKVFFILLFLFSALICAAQKQGNKWYFGIKAGLDFSSGTPVPLFDGKTGTDVLSGYNQEGTSCISDSAGNLLFYSSGATIWNRLHTPMPNGTGLFGGTSATQTSIIVPKPGSTSLYYVFTVDHFQSYGSSGTFQKGYRYSVVDMCMDGGKGDVIVNQKNILMLDSCTEKIAVCADGTGNGYWIVGHKMFSSAFFAWRLTSAGLSAPVISTIGTLHGWVQTSSQWSSAQALGQLKFNPQGTRLALAIENRRPAIIELFDFNKNTGVITGQCYIPIDSLLDKRGYGVEFSPDGSRIYTAVTGGSGGSFLYQFDLTAGDCNAVAASIFRIYTFTGNSLAHGMQLAPNNKIYLVFASNDYVDCLNSPNLSGNAANFTLSSVLLTPGKNSYTLPSFIANYQYPNTAPCSAIPVTLNRLEAVLKGKSVLCKWQTLQEINSSHFVIERGYDGLNFTAISNITAAHNSSLPRDYSFTDPDAFLINTGDLFYRLQVVDNDGHYSYSNIARVKAKNNSSLYIIPNPVKDQLSFSFYSSKYENATLQIMNASGVGIYMKSIVVKKGNNSFEMDARRFSAGVYFVSVIGAEKISGRFIKVRYQ